MSEPPAPPAFGALRLAPLSDLPRIGVVAAAGFKFSQVFEFTRPYHDQYPKDTIKDYRHIFCEQIKNPEWIVLVREDKLDPNEGGGVAAAELQTEGDELPGSSGSKKKPNERVIVGVCSLKLEEGSRRKGHFQPPLPELDHRDGVGQDEGSLEWKSRDKNPERVRRLNSAIEAAEKRHFPHGCMLEMIVVHPTYWRRGHGSALASWGMRLTEIDNVGYGVIASRMGEKLFASLGFEHLEYIHIEGDEGAPDGIGLAALAIRRT